MSNLKLSGKLPKGAAKLCKLPPILEPPNESDNESFGQSMRGCKSVPDLQSSKKPESCQVKTREGKDERTGSRRSERCVDPFYDFLHGSPEKMSSNNRGRESEDDGTNKKVTKASIAEELRRLRQDDRVFKQDFRSLQAKSSLIKHEGVVCGGVSLLHGDADMKPTLSRSSNVNVKLETLPTAKNEIQKLQELMKRQHRELGFTDDPKEEKLEADKDFKSAFKSL